jgi:uroporphyrinogen-III synthase
MRVLVTRPAGDAEATAAALAARGHEAFVAPLFEIRPVPASMEGRFDAVAATSANALRMLDRGAVEPLKPLPLFAVGDATAAAARGLGFSDVRSARGDADDLAQLIAHASPSIGRMLRLAGRDRRDDPFLALPATVAVTTRVTYEAVAVRELPMAAAGMLARGEIDAVLHFSPRAARHFSDLTANLPQGRQPLHVCISAAARDSRFGDARIAAAPTLESLLAALDGGGVSS